jgi:hypothetical protein
MRYNPASHIYFYINYSFWDYPIHFSEFKVVQEKSSTHYPLIWNSNTFDIELTFHRARRHYFLFSIFPTILFTIMSFGQYALDVRGGERLSFSITVVLITVAQGIVTAEYLPVCREMLWLNFLNFISLLFTLFGILETIVILWILTMSAKVKRKTDGENDEEHDSLLSNDVDINNGNDNSNGNDNDSGQISMEITNANEESNEGNQHQQSSTSTSWKDYRFVRLFTKKVHGVEDFTKRVDMVCIVVIPILYFVFIIVMFAGNSAWDDNEDIVELL